MRRDGGFTLIELLVALFVFAILAAASAGILGYSLQSQEALEEASDRYDHLQLTRALLKADLGQLVRRPTRNAFGDAVDGVFIGQDDLEDEPILALVRAGWSNPGGLERRSALQYVQYAIEDGNLVRRSWLRPDRTADTPERRQILLTDVRTVAVSFLGEEGWTGNWPGQAGGGRLIPRAVGIDMVVGDVGHIRQLFLTPGAT